MRELTAFQPEEAEYIHLEVNPLNQVKDSTIQEKKSSGRSNFQKIFRGRNKANTIDSHP